jgi:hypothetical protein
MSIDDQIDNYINSLPEIKVHDMRRIHEMICAIAPGVRLWYLDGKDEQGKVVSNPNIGYGYQEMVYANGSSKPFYRVGISANTTGISVYILGLSDKTYLARTYGATIGKATVTGYCIKFKGLDQINLSELQKAAEDGLLPRDI